MKSESENVDDDKLAEIVSLSWLSKREAELYLLKKTGMNTKEAAEDLGIEDSAAYTYWSNVKDKLRKSKETVDLNIT